jgi:short-subunit dehydrogenase
LLPALTRASGTVVNIVSLAALSAIPTVPSYSISKAAALSMTQSLRELLEPQAVRVHAVMPGPIDTEMAKGFAVRKTSAAVVAAAILDAVSRGEEEIFPDPVSSAFAKRYRSHS